MREECKERLMKNWGDRANAMECYCEIKFIDEHSDWACYIYALNPEDEDTIQCIIQGPWVEIAIWSLQDLYLSYNEQGDNPVIDEEFRRIRPMELLNKIGDKR